MTPFPLLKLKYYKILIKDLFKFIKSPYNNVSIEKTVKNKIYDTVGLFFIKVVFSITIASLLEFIYEPENLTSTSMTERFSPLLLLLVGGILLPLFEEITFRLSLKFSPIYLALTSGTFTYYVLTKSVFKSRLSLIDETFVYRVVIAMIIMLIMFIVFSNKNIRQVLKQYWKNNFKLIYYMSCVSFAWLHIFNFELNLINLLILPILTLPQLFSAFIAGYTRIVFGFQYPLLLHICTNTLFLALTFLPLD
jgi:membrane protease YdiL (CAAX protease family)